MPYPTTASQTIDSQQTMTLAFRPLAAGLINVVVKASAIIPPPPSTTGGGEHDPPPMSSVSVATGCVRARHHNGRLHGVEECRRPWYDAGPSPAVLRRSGR